MKDFGQGPGSLQPAVVTGIGDRDGPCGDRRLQEAAGTYQTLINYSKDSLMWGWGSEGPQGPAAMMTMWGDWDTVGRMGDILYQRGSQGVSSLDGGMESEGVGKWT